MAYELKQELKLSQNLVMTPQLQMAIKLLQLGRLELVDTIKEELQANPVLEETVDTDSPSTPEPPPPTPEPEPPSPEVDWQAYLEDQSSGSAPSINFNRADEDQESPIGNVSSAPESLADHLMWQLSVSGLSEDDQRLGEYIIGNIGDDGYLRLVERGSMTDVELEEATVREVSEHTGVGEADVERVLSAIQQFDPAGVGSRHLKECLMTQALMCPVRDTLVEEIIGRHLEDLARHDLKKIARALGAEVDEVVEAAATINRCLNPTPGSGYGADESRAITPDVFITRVGDDYVITLNEDGLPKLKVSPYYRALLSGGGGNGTMPDQAKGYIQDKLRSAMWLIKSVHQRQRTIYRVVECIVKFQKDFLDKGLKYLRPLVLKDVAAEIEVHESTVSRVTSNKYVQTPRGIFELKYFFSSAVSSSSEGDDMTAEYIKERIKAILKDEDPRKPLSDQQIVEALAAEGIKLARRTAAKYREAIGFLSSSRRKVRY